MENSNYSFSKNDEAQFNAYLLPLLSGLIQNACVNDGSESSGNEIKNATLLGKFFSEAKINYLLNSPKDESLKNRTSIISVTNGTSLNPITYCFMGHIDVVPANKEKWSFDPFAAKLEDSTLYGRGAVDMLNQVAVMAAAYRSVIEELGIPKNTVKFIGVADEEADGVLGSSRLIEEQKELCACDYIISELGGYFIDPTHVAIATSEKGVLRLTLEASGTAAHGSMPYKADNAILKLTSAIEKLSSIYSKPFYTPAAISMIKAMPLSEAEKSNLLDENQVESALEAIYNRSSAIAKLLHSALFLTISVGVIKGGTKVNIVADSASCALDIRLPFGVTKEDLILEFKKHLGDEIKLSVMEYFLANSSEQNTPFFDAIEESAKDIYPQVQLVPVIPAGVSDCRYWRVNTEVKAAYGFCLFSKNYTYDFFAKYLHGVDEQIDIESLKIAFVFYKNLMKRLLY